MVRQEHANGFVEKWGAMEPALSSVVTPDKVSSTNVKIIYFQLIAFFLFFPNKLLLIISVRFFSKYKKKKKIFSNFENCFTFYKSQQILDFKQ